MLAGLWLVDRDRGDSMIADKLIGLEKPLVDRLSALAALEFIDAEIGPDDQKSRLKKLEAALRDPDAAARMIDLLRRAECWSSTDAVLDAPLSPRERSALLRYVLVCPGERCRAYLSNVEKNDRRSIEQAEQELAFERSAKKARDDARRSPTREVKRPP
jgi:hypothetical protein